MRAPRCILQPGNRDFLLGERFCGETGVTLLGDYEVIDLYGVPTLLTHGDLLCTDDLPYQAFRAKSHTPEWMRSVLSQAAAAAPFGRALVPLAQLFA